MKVKKVLQYNGREVLIDELEGKVKELWKQEGKLQKNLKTLELYIKAEENKCYYVINSTVTGCLELAE